MNFKEVIGGVFKKKDAMMMMVELDDRAFLRDFFWIEPLLPLLPPRGQAALCGALAVPGA
jgi:hypothetical protein